MNLLALALGSVAGIIAAASGAFVAVRKLGAEQAKTGAEAEAAEATAADTVVDSALKLIAPYVEQAERNERAIQSLRARVSILEAHVSTLEVHLRENEIPVPSRPNY